MTIVTPNKTINMIYDFNKIKYSFYSSVGGQTIVDYLYVENDGTVKEYYKRYKITNDEKEILERKNQTFNATKESIIFLIGELKELMKYGETVEIFHDDCGSQLIYDLFEIKHIFGRYFRYNNKNINNIIMDFIRYNNHELLCFSKD